jgi:H/ACA ribonucleoprotein complex subunit 4
MKINLEKIKNEKPIKELLEFSIINIDKPTGPTSFDTDTVIKDLIGANKTSHFGTLDPMVTGVLPVALNRACRLMNYFIGHKKEYTGIMHIHEDISADKLKEQMNNFLGKITQLPPVKSRVKRQEREREIYSFEILEKHDKDILFKTEVEAGTYIRKLIHDLGEKINGAHMTELRRTKASIFQEKDSITIFQLKEAVEEYKKGNEKPIREILIPGEIISQILQVVQIKKEYSEVLYHGSHLFKEHLIENYNFKPEEKIAVFSDQKFIGVFKTIKNPKVIGLPEFVLQPIKSNNKIYK